jgi:hypothetical protein
MGRDGGPGLVIRGEHPVIPDESATKIVRSESWNETTASSTTSSGACDVATAAAVCSVAVAARWRTPPTSSTPTHTPAVDLMLPPPLPTVAR